MRRLGIALLVMAAACSTGGRGGAEDAGNDSAAGDVSQQKPSLPPGESDAMARLDSSPRHGVWKMIAVPGGDSVRAWIVFPERSDKAPVVVVVHEIFGLTPWIRAVADQFAAEGFIAIAPDFLTGKGVSDAPEGPPRDSAVAAVRKLDAAEVQRRIDAVAKYGTALPAATDKYGIVGFCWGGGVSFAHAVHAPDVDAAVVFYGTSPATERLSSVTAPVLGNYGADDARVNATIGAADSALRAMGKVYEHHEYKGAGHGFLRAQDGREGANMAATREAWPRTVAWFRRYLQ